jgi:sugar lactone lactonase YvrE
MKKTLAALLLLTAGAQAQDSNNGLSAPFKVGDTQWATPPAGKPWGSTAGVERGPKGEIWAIDRCGANSCDGSDRDPLILLDTKTGTAIRSMGKGLFVFPHGLHVDRQGNVWVADGGVSKDGSKGLQVTKLSPEGKVLLTLGTAGQRGLDGAHFQSPSDVITAPNGDIFVADGHGAIAGTVPDGLQMRIVKFDKTGKFIAAWGGVAGAGPAQFNTPHALALDGKGRLYVADRSNNRIQILSQDGKLLETWKQFGRPSGFYIAGDRLYAIDADSSPANHPGGWKHGIWIGSISRALPDAFVEDAQAGEGIVVAPDGTMLGGVNVAPRGITRYVKK